MSYAILTGSTGSSRASSIVVDEDDENKPEEDNSDADTVRMSTPDYERWAIENCRIKSQNLFLTDSTPASTFLKYRSCQQSDYTQIAQSGSPIAGEESNNTGVFKKENPDLKLSSDALCATHVQAGRFSPTPSKTSKSAIEASMKSLHTNIPAKRKMRNELRANIPKRRSMRLKQKERMQ